MFYKKKKYIKIFISIIVEKNIYLTLLTINNYRLGMVFVPVGKKYKENLSNYIHNNQKYMYFSKIFNTNCLLNKKAL